MFSRTVNMPLLKKDACNAYLLVIIQLQALEDRDVERLKFVTTMAREYQQNNIVFSGLFY